MAIESVSAKLGDNKADLQNESQDIYAGSITAPEEHGLYPLEITAHDDAGNVIIDDSTIINVSLWHAPKTNWTVNDRFNWVDYNRIKNNLQYLHDKAVELWHRFEIQNMGEDIKQYTGKVTASSINAFEKNLETISKNAVLKQNFGMSKTFYPNGVFIDWEELNRIEGAILVLKELLDRQESSLRKIPFTLGRFREVRI